MWVCTVTTQIGTIELNPKLVNMAYEMGLNVPKTCENALKEAIRRPKGLTLKTPVFATRRSPKKTGALHPHAWWNRGIIIAVFTNIILIYRVHDG
jgi:hypothetical protein